MENNFEDTMVLKKVQDIKEGVIKNNELKKLIRFKINKTEIEEQDLLDITEISLNGKTLTGSINMVYFKELELFPNLKKIEINNLNVSNEDIKQIEKIEDISFRNCDIESLELLKNVRKLSLKSSKVANIEEIENFSNLTDLEIVNIEIDGFNFLKNLKNLKVLKLKNIENLSTEKISFSLPIEYFSIQGMDKLEIKLIEKYKNLKTLSIELEKKNEWKEILEKLKEKDINILIDEIYKY